MANLCSILIKLYCESEEQTKSLKEELELMNDEELENVNESIMPLFGLEISYDDSIKSLICVGWIKWGFKDDEIVSFVNYVNSRYKLKYMCVDYEECGLKSYGSYVYEDGYLIDYFINENDFPEVPEDDDWDTYHETLDYLLENNSSKKYLIVPC